MLLVTAFGAFLVPVDNSMLYIATPQVAMALKADPALVTWVPIASLVSLTALLMPLGRLSDVWGRKRLYVVGLIAAILTSLLSGISQTVYQLMAIRLLQGFGAALLTVNGLSLVSEAFASRERGKALGLHSAATFLGLSLGPLIGGLLVTQFGWRSIFFVVIPFYLIVLALACIKLPRPASGGQRRGYDFSGSLSFIGAVVLLMIALSLGRIVGWVSPFTLSFSACGAALVGLFIYIETRVASEPMIDLRIIRHNSQFTMGSLANLCQYLSAHQGVTILMAFYVQWTLNMSAAVAGVIMLAKFFTMALFSPLSGWLSDRIDTRWLCTVGMGLITVSLLLLSGMDANTSLANVFLRLSVLGVGIGLFASPNIKSVMGSLPQDKLGLASGTLGTSRSLGSALGLALVASILAGGAATPALGERTTSAFLILAVAGFLGVVFSVLRGYRPASADQ